MSTYGRQEHLLGLWKGNSNVTILIDADGCPVVDLTVQTATKYKVPVLILCDTAHQIQRDGAQTLTFDKGPDGVDFALVNRVHPGDLVFFEGTYDTPGKSHVGIYLGNGMMVSAGDPIKYANIHSSYWQKYLSGFGRLSK